VLELEHEGDETRSHHLDVHRDDDAQDRDPVGCVAGDRGQRHRLLAV
jgi:hypothetical protein